MAVQSQIEYTPRSGQFQYHGQIIAQIYTLFFGIDSKDTINDRLEYLKPEIHAVGNDLVRLLTNQSDADEQEAILFQRLQQADIAPLPSEFFSTVLHLCDVFARTTYQYIQSSELGDEGKRWLLAGLVSAWLEQRHDRISLFGGQLALWHERRGKINEAMQFYEFALSATIEMGDIRRQVAIMFGLAKTLETQGKMLTAISYYEDLLPLMQATDDVRGEGIALKHIGTIYEQLGNTTRALDYYERTLKAFLTAQDALAVADALSNLGRIVHQKMDIDHAVQYFQEALGVQQAIGETSHIAYTLYQLGRLYHQLEAYDKALHYYEQSLPLLVETHNTALEAIQRTHMALIYWQKNQHALANACAQSALELKKQNGQDYQDDEYIVYLMQNQPEKLHDLINN